MSLTNTKQTLKRINDKLTLFGWKIIYDWSFSLSALIAYYLLISLLPLILSMFAVVSLIFGNDPKFQNQIRDRLIKAFPEQGLIDVLDALLNSLSNQAGLIFMISFIISIFTGSRLFIGLDDVLTVIYRIRERTILNQNILAIKMILAFIIIMPFIIILSSIPAIMERHESFYQFLTTIFSGILSFILFQLIYIILPKRQMSWKHTYV
jgi:membrane protein